MKTAYMGIETYSDFTDFCPAPYLSSLFLLLALEASVVCIWPQRASFAPISLLVRSGKIWFSRIIDFSPLTDYPSQTFPGLSDFSTVLFSKSEFLANHSAVLKAAFSFSCQQMESLVYSSTSWLSNHPFLQN